MERDARRVKARPVLKGHFLHADRCGFAVIVVDIPSLGFASRLNVVRTRQAPDKWLDPPSTWEEHSPHATGREIHVTVKVRQVRAHYLGDVGRVNAG